MAAAAVAHSEACDDDHPDNAASGDQGQSHVFPASAGQDVLDEVVEEIAIHVTFVTQSAVVPCGLRLLTSAIAVPAQALEWVALLEVL
jgi:hypothetical protein